MVQAIHAAVKGRVRYRVDGLYRSRALKEALEDRFAEKDGINAFSANFLTGHVMVCFNPGLNQCH